MTLYSQPTTIINESHKVTSEAITVASRLLQSLFNHYAYFHGCCVCNRFQVDCGSEENIALCFMMT